MLQHLQDGFSGNFMAHGYCYLWKPQLVWLHLSSDFLIALSYYSIPLLLIYFVRQRKDLPFQGIFILFSAFILSCGTTHLAEIWTLWHPELLVIWFTKSYYGNCFFIYSFNTNTFITKSLSIAQSSSIRNC